MRLEVGTFAVKDAEFGSRAKLEKGVLTVNKEELRRLILEDSSFRDVEIHIAKPGDSTRIIHALDVVEPRWKVEGPGTVFPGFIGPPVTVGEGKTNRLAGAAVVAAGEPVPGEPTHFRQALIDMSGPGAEYGPFGKTTNVVLVFKPNMEMFPEGAAQAKDVIGGTARAQAYNTAITKACLTAAAYLGKVTVGMKADGTEAFELKPCDPSLLKVALVYQATRPTLYGAVTGLTAATMIHPNESFDGALVSRRGTYLEQNNEVLVELCRLHGKEVNFVGYVLFGDTTPAIEQKERVSSSSSKMVSLVGAQAALLLGQNGSNLAIDCMWTLQKCEKAGVKTALIYTDAGMGAEDPGFIFFVPEADAIVSTGTREQPVKLPAVKKVLGGTHLVDPEYDAQGELNLAMRYIHSAINVSGMSKLTTRFM